MLPTALLAFGSGVCVCVAQTIVVPISAPASAVPLDPSLVSFSIEQDRWTDWAGIDAPNSFFLNALDNLAQRTGRPPWIRIGADSADHTDFSEHIEYAETTFPQPSAGTPYPEATNITVGQKYYELASHLPRGTHVIWGVNFGSSNITAASLQARAIKAAFDSSEVVEAGVTLQAIEIGNEVDIYGFTGRRDPATWTIDEYVNEWTAFAESVSVAAQLGESGPGLWGLSFNLPGGFGGPFSVEDALSSGILDSVGGRLITEISQHRYSGSLDAIATIPTMMSKASIRANLSVLVDDIAAVQAQGLAYVLGETNTYFLHGEPGVSNTAGAAIWVVDYTLLAASLGIKRAHFHEGIGYRYNFIQPVPLNRSIIDGSPLPEPLAPHVQPIYYGALVVAEAIGTSGLSRIAEIDISDDTLSAYAVYEDGSLKRTVLINSRAFLSGENAESRTANNVTVMLGGGEALNGVITSAGVRRLRIDRADDTNNLTWDGQSFETKDGRASGAVRNEVLKFYNGSITVSLNATEALLLSFH